MGGGSAFGGAGWLFEAASVAPVGAGAPFIAGAAAGAGFDDAALAGISGLTAASPLFTVGFSRFGGSTGSAFALAFVASGVAAEPDATVGSATAARFSVFSGLGGAFFATG